MDWYEKELMARAVEACERSWGSLRVRRDGLGWHVMLISGLRGQPSHATAAHTTLADALTALLTDLGEEVPERPSAERVADETDPTPRPLRPRAADRPRPPRAGER